VIFMADPFPESTRHDAGADASPSTSGDPVGEFLNLTRDTARQASEPLAAAPDSLQDTTLRAAKDSAPDARDTVVDKANSAAQATHGYVSPNPWMAISAAAAAGLAIGMLLRRR
jgi:ElaB/YqjD/DUF883 family membrane-anchored ribosome-binding protein